MKKKQMLIFLAFLPIQTTIVILITQRIGNLWITAPLSGLIGFSFGFVIHRVVRKTVQQTEE